MRDDVVVLDVRQVLVKRRELVKVGREQAEASDFTSDVSVGKRDMRSATACSLADRPC